MDQVPNPLAKGGKKGVSQELKKAYNWCLTEYSFGNSGGHKNNSNFMVFSVNPK